VTSSSVLISRHNHVYYNGVNSIQQPSNDLLGQFSVPSAGAKRFSGTLLICMRRGTKWSTVGETCSQFRISSIYITSTDPEGSVWDCTIQLVRIAQREREGGGAKSVMFVPQISFQGLGEMQLTSLLFWHSAHRHWVLAVQWHGTFDLWGWDHYTVSKR
jgi:hypothetical protein